MFHIRAYTKDDQEFVINGLVDLTAVEAPIHDSRRAPERGFCTEYLVETLQEAHSHGGEFLIATVGDQRVGLAGYWIVDEHVLSETEDSCHYGYVSDIWVVPEWRGKGAGKALLDEVAERLRLRGDIKRMRITALSSNETALRAYRNAGFAPYETTLERIIPGDWKVK
ncbi:MAG: GNAT family N-acetyltransferase [Parvularculaceae bacterium]